MASKMLVVGWTARVNRGRLLLVILLLVLLALSSLPFPTVASAQDCVAPQMTPGRGLLRAPLDSIPLAKPDQHTAEVDRRTRIDVLANDKGVFADVELQLEDAPSCGEAGIDGRSIWYQGGRDCMGQSVVFKYRAKLRDARTCEPEWKTAFVTVTVAMTPAPPPPRPEVRPAPEPRPPQISSVSCDIPDSRARFIKIEGGRFVVAEAPPVLADFARLVEEPVFTVATFCLMVEEISAEEFDRFFRPIGDAQKRERFPEVFEQMSDNNAPSVPGVGAPAVGNISRRMAEAYAKQLSEQSGRTLSLPTLNELVAAVLELQNRRPESPEASLLTIGLRSGNLQWTSTPCAETGSFLTLGPSSQGPLTKLCYNESRNSRTGFRLTVR
jgi:hypothetical protein